MLEALRMRAVGKISVRLQRAVGDQADVWAAKLILGGVELWRLEDFHRFDDGELSFSVRLFYFCDRLIHENQQAWPLIHIEYDAVQPTREMLLGIASPKTAPRPDFCILFGRDKIRVEAKRLRDGDGLPALYVRRGMARFIDGRYRSSPPHPGVMVGYVETGNVDAVVDRINSVLVSEPGYGESHLLRSSRIGDEVAACVSTYRSEHGSDLRLHHYEIDLLHSDGAAR